MPCRDECDMRLLLLAKEGKISKLHQTKEWIKELGQSEPLRGEEIQTKLQVVNNMIAQSLAEAGLLVTQIARGCNNCAN